MKITHWLNGNTLGYNMLNDQYSIAVSVNTDKLGFALDPEKHLAWIESQRPQPPYVIEGTNLGHWDVRYDPSDTWIASFANEPDAETFRDLLNERAGAE